VTKKRKTAHLSEISLPSGGDEGREEEKDTCPHVAVVGSLEDSSLAHFVSVGGAEHAREHFAAKYIDRVPICSSLLLPPQGTTTASFLDQSSSLSHDLTCAGALYQRPVNGNGVADTAHSQESREGGGAKRPSSSVSGSSSSSSSSSNSSRDQNELVEGKHTKDDTTLAESNAGTQLVCDMLPATAVEGSSHCQSQRQTVSRVFCTSDGQVERDSASFHNPDAVNNSLWMTEHTNRVIGEYLDVNLVEKGFMCKWNQHIASFPTVYADLYVSNISKLFASRHAHFLLQHNMRYVFLLHLMSLWDHSLLTLDDVEKCIAIVDQAGSEE